MRDDEIDDLLAAPADRTLDGMEQAVWSRLAARQARRQTHVITLCGVAMLLVAVAGGAGLGVTLAPSGAYVSVVDGTDLAPSFLLLGAR